MAKTAAQQLTLVFAHKLFVLDGQARALSPKTLSVYSEQLTWFARYAAAADVTLLHEVDPPLLKSYLIHLQQQGWKPASVHIAFRVLRTFFRFLHADGLKVRAHHGLAALGSVPQPAGVFAVLVD